MHHLLFSQVNLSTEEFQKTPLLDHLQGIDTINQFFILYSSLRLNYRNILDIFHPNNKFP